jgi:hypothetical protein
MSHISTKVLKHFVHNILDKVHPLKIMWQWIWTCKHVQDNVNSKLDQKKKKTTFFNWLIHNDLPRCQHLNGLSSSSVHFFMFMSAR